MAPVVLGKIHPQLGREALEHSQVNVTLQVVITMEEWARAGILKDAAERVLTMEKEAGHVLKVGLEAWQEE